MGSVIDMDITEEQKAELEKAYTQHFKDHFMPMEGRRQGLPGSFNGEFGIIPTLQVLDYLSRINPTRKSG